MSAKIVTEHAMTVYIVTAHVKCMHAMTAYDEIAYVISAHFVACQKLMISTSQNI